jgi:uncharacterized protein
MFTLPGAEPGEHQSRGPMHEEDEVATPIHEEPREPEEPQALEGPRKLEGRVLALWWMVAFAWALVLSTGAFMAHLLILPGIDALRWLRDLGPWPMVALFFLWAIFVPPLRYRRWRYALRDDDLWIRQGIFWRSVSVIPYRRLQFVDTRQGPLENLFGLAQLVVHTAAPGTSGLVPGLDREEAETIRERLAALAGEADDPV